MAATATSSSTSALSKSGSAASTRPAVPITRVAIRDGKTIAINDHIYISVPWAPGSGEPYAIARVMEFVTASPSRKGGQVLASSSGTLQVRANVYLRQRELNNKSISDPRLLVATMHSDVFALDNVRGLCVVRHRDLIGEATEVAAWKKREDHFYYYQLFDRYIHKSYDVIPTDKIRNVPFDVLTVLRNRYSFVAAEPSMTPDLCGALRGCAICLKWTSSTESVRCDTCKDFFHMHCLNPPLASKPAKGYSWTCAPCTRRHETVASGLPISRTAALDASAAIASSSSSSSSSVAALSSIENPENTSYTVNRISDSNQKGAASGAARGRGRGRGGRGKGASQGLTRSGLLASDEIGSSDQSRESSPSPYLSLPKRTIDDERGTRCFNRWPYRYFGECILATDILDPHDSIYPRAIPRLGIKFQTYPITWEEQVQLGIGVKATKDFESDGTVTPISEEPNRFRKLVGRPSKKKKDDTPIGTPTIPTISLPTEVNNLIRIVTDKEIERGTDESVEPLYLPGSVADKTVDKYIKICKKQMPDLANHIGMLDRALKLLSQYTGDAGRALHELTNSTNEELMVDTWSLKESKQFNQIVTDYNADLRFLKKEIPTKTVTQIVRHFAYWKCKRIANQREEEKRLALEKPGFDITASNGNKTELVTRAVSPSMSIMEDDDRDYPLQLLNKMCRMCATSNSTVWYKGAVVWSNRRLCVNCGLYWRKYGAEMPSSHPDMISTRKRDAAAMEEASLGVAPPVKAAKLSRTESHKGSSPAQSTIALFEPTKCVLCKKMEPKKKLQQCRQCSLSVHQGCYGLNDQELADDSWFCEACSNERTLDATLTPQCVLCPVAKVQTLVKEASVPPLAQATIPERIMGRARKSASIPPSNVSPLGALDAVKPTECNNWTHFNCALFIPEIAFTEPERMRIVEGAGNLPFWRYEAHCDICNQRGGACVGCADSSCKRTFHISCASQQSSFTLGIDLSPVKSTRRDTVVTTTFRGETGHMTAVIYCNNHKEVAKSRNLLDLSDLDSVTNLTATQVFASTHKTVKTSLPGSQYDASTYPLLRRAKRFDAVLSVSLSILSRSNSKKPLQHTIRLSTNLPGEDDIATTTSSIRQEKSPVEDDKTLLSAAIEQSSKYCCRCKTCFSPFWWLLPFNAEEIVKDSSNEWLQEAQEKQSDSLLCVRCRHLILPRLVM